jgi:ribosome maturation factor RimP
MDLQALLEKTLPGLGYEFVDLNLGNRGKMLQVFIDKPGGVTIEDCTAVSHHLSRLLAVDLDYDYDRLEVSSPGLDRPLRTEAAFERFRGEQAQLKLRVPVEGRRKFVGVLGVLKNGILEMEVDGELKAFAMENIDKARLVPAI